MEPASSQDPPQKPAILEYRAARSDPGLVIETDAQGLRILLPLPPMWRQIVKLCFMTAGWLVFGAALGVNVLFLLLGGEPELLAGLLLMCIMLAWLALGWSIIAGCRSPQPRVILEVYNDCLWVNRGRITERYPHDEIFCIGIRRGRLRADLAYGSELVIRFKVPQFTFDDDLCFLKNHDITAIQSVAAALREALKVPEITDAR